MSRRGNSLVELALGLPVLMVLLTGLADYGLFFLQRATMLNAAKDATRIAVASPELQDPVAMAEQHAADILEAVRGCGDCSIEARVVSLDGARRLATEKDRNSTA